MLAFQNIIDTWYIQHKPRFSTVHEDKYSYYGKQGFVLWQKCVSIDDYYTFYNKAILTAFNA